MWGRIRPLGTRAAELTGRYAGRVVRRLVGGMLMFAAVIGALFITRGTAVRRVRGIGGDGAPISPAEPTFPLAVALLTGSAIIAGNRVELALNGDETYPRLWADLRSARRAITVQMYYAAPGRVADSLGAILTERARAGVSVYLLCDAFGSSLTDDYLARLRAAGIHCEAFRPLRFRNLWVVQNRSHVRGVVVDGIVGRTEGLRVSADDNAREDICR
jgi:cardiolipin synthase